MRVKAIVIVILFAGLAAAEKPKKQPEKSAQRSRIWLLPVPSVMVQKSTKKRSQKFWEIQNTHNCAASPTML